MRLRIIVTLVFVASLLLAVAGSACLGGDNGDGEASEAMLNMMKRVPDNFTMFMFYDVEGIGANEDWEDMLGDLDDTGGMDLDMDEVDVMASGMTAEFDMIMLLEGSFDSGDPTDGLEMAGYTSETYNGVEVWVVGEGAFSNAMAFWDNLLVMGSEDAVKDCIDVIEGGEASLYDKDDYGDVADRLGDGLIAMLMDAGDMGPQGMEGAEVLGFSYDAKDSNTAKIRAAVVFEDEDAAEAAMDDVDAQAENENWENVDIDRSGKIIEAEGEIDLDDVELFQ
jgi:hypothetical protein